MSINDGVNFISFLKAKRECCMYTQCTYLHTKTTLRVAFSAMSHTNLQTPGRGVGEANGNGSPQRHLLSLCIHSRQVSWLDLTAWVWNSKGKAKGQGISEVERRNGTECIQEGAGPVWYNLDPCQELLSGSGSKWTWRCSLSRAWIPTNWKGDVNDSAHTVVSIFEEFVRLLFCFNDKDQGHLACEFWNTRLIPRRDRNSEATCHVFMWLLFDTSNSSWWNTETVEENI